LENNRFNDNIFEDIETLNSDETEDESVDDIIYQRLKNRKSKTSNFQISQENENAGQEEIQFWDEDFKRNSKSKTKHEIITLKLF
jgi:hypothetical protein